MIILINTDAYIPHKKYIHVNTETMTNYPTSVPPTFTVIFIGKGERFEFVIGGTAARPASDDV